MKLILQEDEIFSHTVRKLCCCYMCQTMSLQKFSCVSTFMKRSMVLKRAMPRCHNRLFTACLFTDAKEKASEANEQHAGVWGGFSVSTHTCLSLPFCAGVQFSHDSIRAFNDRVKTREKQRALNSVCHKRATSRFAHLELSLNFSTSSFVIRVNFLHP